MALQVTISLKDKMTSGLKNISGQLKKISTDVLKFGFASATAFSSIAIKQAAEFEKGISEIATLTDGLTRKEIKELKNELSALAISSGQSLQPLIKARYDIVSAGFSGAADSAMVLNSAVKLAVGGVTEASAAADLLTTALNAYQLTALESQAVSDLLFTTVKKGKTTMDELASSLGKVLPIASAAKLDLSAVGAAMATITAAGISTAEASTALTGAMRSLSAPAKEAKTAMESAGISVKYLADGTMDLYNTVKQFSGMSVDELSRFIPDLRAGTAIISMANNIEVLRQNIDAMSESAGASEGAYETMLDSFTTKMNQLRQNVNKIFTDIGAVMIEKLSPVVDKINSKLAEIGTEIGWENIAKLILMNLDAILKAAIISAGAGAKIIGLKIGDSLISGLKETFPALDETIEKMSGIFDKLGNAWSNYASSAKASARFVKSIFKGESTEIAVTAAKTAFSFEEFGKTVQTSDEKIAELSNTIKTALNEAFTQIKTQAIEIKTETEAAEDATEEFGETAIEMSEKVEDSMTSISESIKVTFSQAFDDMTNKFQKALADWQEQNKAFVADIQTTMQSVGSFVNNFLHLRQIGILRNLETEIEAIQKSTAAQIRAVELSALNEEEKSNKITYIKEQQHSKEQELKRKAEQLEKESRRKMKPLMVAEAVAGTALAVINALQVKPFIPLGVAAGAMAGAAGAAQVAIIEAQSFATGGKVQPMQDIVPSFLTPGESVNTKNTTEVFGEKIAYMNNVSESVNSNAVGTNNSQTIIIQAMDAKSFQNFLKQNPEALSKGIKTAQKRRLL